VKRLRVLYLIDSLGPGGAQRQLVTLVRALDRSLVEPEVAVYHEMDHFRPELVSAGVPVHLLMGVSGRDPMVLLGLSQLITRGGYDIVHSYLRTPGTLARLATLRSRSVRVVVSERNVGLGDSRLRLMLERLLEGRADAMIANAHAISQEVERLVPAWSGRVHVVPNGIEWTEPSADERAAGEEFRKKHAAGAEVLLGALGRLERQKAPEVLVEALALLPGEAVEKLRVVWVGRRIDDELARRVEARVAGTPLSDRFTLLPATRETRTFYLGVDAVVMPSRWEGMPNVILESLAHGTPVISSDVGDAALLMGESPAGWLVPREDPPALAAAIEKLLGTSDSDLAAMGARGAVHVHREFSAARLAERTMAVYEKVMRRD
jgi:glycosyltransferase involved in cell wall biosynthesis